MWTGFFLQEILTLKYVVPEIYRPPPPSKQVFFFDSPTLPEFHLSLTLWVGMDIFWKQTGETYVIGVVDQWLAGWTVQAPTGDIVWCLWTRRLIIAVLLFSEECKWGTEELFRQPTVADKIPMGEGRVTRDGLVSHPGEM